MDHHDHEPNSYRIETPEGVQYKRNKRHIIRTNEKCEDKMDDNVNDDQIESETQVENNVPLQKQNNTKYPYVTRSGRTVVPPKRLIME